MLRILCIRRGRRGSGLRLRSRRRSRRRLQVPLAVLDLGGGICKKTTIWIFALRTGREHVLGSPFLQLGSRFTGQKQSKMLLCGLESGFGRIEHVQHICQHWSEMAQTDELLDGRCGCAIHVSPVVGEVHDAEAFHRELVIGDMAGTTQPACKPLSLSDHAVLDYKQRGKYHLSWR